MPPSPAVKSPKKVLIVEDDRAIFNAISLLLKHYEFEAVVAPTLAHGRQLLQTKPDLVILDLLLPDGDGLELLEKIRTTGQKTQVFILTGDSKPETERKIRRWMPDRYFRKPLNFIEILEAIRERLVDAAPAGGRVASLIA